MYRNSAAEVKSSAESCSHGEHTDTARQMHRTASKTKVSRKRAVRCVDCRKKFDDWRALQRHKRNCCSKSSLRFSCRECRAFFPSETELKSHSSSAHVGHKSKNTRSTSSRRNKLEINSPSYSDVTVVDLKKASEFGHSLKRKKVHKCLKNSNDLKKRRSVCGYKAANRVGKLNRRIGDIRTVGINPFSFTTSCAPDAQLFQFLCQSCLTVRFATYVELRQHEDWCARVRNSEGFLCLPCGRHYRNLGTLRRHADEYHKIPVSSEAKKIAGNPFRFSTTIALDAESYPHVCSSCLLACFSSPIDLRRHEDWCGQCVSAEDGSRCDNCGRYFRTAGLLERHAVADDCMKTNTTRRTNDDGTSKDDIKSEGWDSDTKQIATPATAVHSVCPLCDVPFMNHQEQQAHFLNVHNLTSSELKIKQLAQRESRRGFVGSQVTCLDCDLLFSSRLELVQHKRVCTKEKKFTEVILPVTPRVVASHNRSGVKIFRSVKDRSSFKKGDISKTNRATISSNTSGRNAAECRNQGEGEVTGLLCRTTGTQRLQFSRSLLLNTTKVRSLIRHSSAKRLLLKSDGELLLIDDGGQKISAGNGKQIVKNVSGDCRGVETFSSRVENSSRQGFSKKFSGVTNPKVDTESLPASLGSDHSTLGDKTVDCSREPRAEKCTSSSVEDRKCPAESVELASSTETENNLQPTSPAVNLSVGQQRAIRQLADKVARRKKLEAKTSSVSVLKTCSEVSKRWKSTRKRSLHSEEIVATDADSKNQVNTVLGRDVKNVVMEEQQQPLLRKTRRRTSADSEHHSFPKAVDLPSPACDSEVRVREVESSSEAEVTVGQETLLEALQLVPISAQLNRPVTNTARYRTRSSAHAHDTLAKGGATKMSRGRYNGKDVAESSSQKGLELSAKTASNRSKTEAAVKRKDADVRGQLVPQKTRTVELVGDSLVRCVACKTVFQTVRQIVDHTCAG